uniref:Uncharacterized protein n=1 Tax=Arundo donax TaxID=35708 RepID=A0A0A8YDQ4_ARUDO
MILSVRKGKKAITRQMIIVVLHMTSQGKSREHKL